MVWQRWCSLGCFLAGLAVVLGAFAAHALKNKLNVYELQVFETAVRYQMYHSFALIVLGISQSFLGSSAWTMWSGYCFSLGTFLFSGSLYLLVMSSMKWLGMITPLGGLNLIAGWVLLGISFLVSAK
jgi:uncharacterized membrane protein YgdD (TMEM256/DUF423 family)